MCCEVHWWGENEGQKKISHPQKLEAYSLVVMLTQVYELGHTTVRVRETLFVCIYFQEKDAST